MLLTQPLFIFLSRPTGHKFYDVFYEYIFMDENRRHFRNLLDSQFQFFALVELWVFRYHILLDDFVQSDVSFYFIRWIN